MNLASTIELIAGTVLPSLLVAWASGLVIRKYAAVWGLVDRPGGRKSHGSPIPLGGGLAIWLGVTGTFALGHIALAAATLSATPFPLPTFLQPHVPGLQATMPQLWWFLGLATAIMLLGLADDRWSLAWWTRLLVQLAVAGLVVGVLNWKLTFYVSVPVISTVVSIVWIVGLINSFNMLDNMDGLSAGVAAIATAALAAVMLMAPDPETNQPQLFVAGFFLVLLGSLLGFLWHNRHPAKLFMGDAGSYFIGFCLAVSTMIATFAGYERGTQHAILAPLVALAVPLYDTCTVVWIRLRNGKSPFEADRNHFSHRLVDLGLTPPQAVRTIYLLTAACAMGAVLLHRLDVVGACVVVVMVLCVLSVIAILESTARRQLLR